MEISLTTLHTFNEKPFSMCSMPADHWQSFRRIPGSSYFQPLTGWASYFQPLTEWASYFQPLTGWASYFQPLMEWASYFQPLTGWASYFQPLKGWASYFRPQMRNEYLCASTQHTLNGVVIMLSPILFAKEFTL